MRFKIYEKQPWWIEVSYEYKEYRSSFATLLPHSIYKEYWNLKKEMGAKWTEAYINKRLCFGFYWLFFKVEFVYSK